MTASSDRQWQRVECQLPVQLQVRVGSEPAPRMLQARSINLSEGGILLSASDALPIGEHVTCSLLLEGRPTELPGYVRWSKPTLPGLGKNGVGIQFDVARLSPDHNGLLKSLVERATRGDQPVEIYFPSLKAPVHARAFTTEAGLQIRAALPVLTRDSDVEFQFGGRGPRFLGRIAQVAVFEHDRTPHIEVELAIAAREMPRFRRYTMYGDEIEASTEDTAQTPQSWSRNRTLQVWNAPAVEEIPKPSIEPESTRATEPPDAPAWVVPKHALSRLASKARLPIALLLLGATLGAALAWLFLASGMRPKSVTASAAHAPHAPHASESATAVGGGAAREPTAMPSRTGAPVLSAVAAHPLLQTAPTERAGAAGRSNPQPLLVSSDDVTEITLPFTGTIEALQARLWAAPPALVIDVPRAQLTLPSGPALTSKHVLRLALADTTAGAQLRVFLRTKPLRHDVRVSGDRLRIRLAHSTLAELKEPRSLRHGATAER